jgi:hypothetical protein
LVYPVISGGEFEIALLCCSGGCFTIVLRICPDWKCFADCDGPTN